MKAIVYDSLVRLGGAWQGLKVTWVAPGCDKVAGGCPQLLPASLTEGDALSSSSWNRIVDSAPIDRTAAEILREGTHYDPDPATAHGEPWFDDRPATIPVPRQVRDFTGFTAGLLKVVGYAGKIGKHKRWVCRCVCGRFRHIRHGALKRPGLGEDPQSCAVCENVARLRRGRPSLLQERTRGENAR